MKQEEHKASMIRGDKDKKSSGNKSRRLLF